MGVYNVKCPVQGCLKALKWPLYLCARHEEELYDWEKHRFQVHASMMYQYRMDNVLDIALDDYTIAKEEAWCQRLLQRLAQADLHAQRKGMPDEVYRL